MNAEQIEELRRKFESATEFNDLFDTFEQAVALGIDDPELYKVLFWNKTLSADEITLFADQLVKKFPHLAFDLYIWLGDMSALTLAKDDNFEHALEYYRKAALANPKAIEPYQKAYACYDPVVKIPSEQILIEFIKSGISHAAEPEILYEQLSELYRQIDNDEMTEYYSRLSGKSRFRR